MARRIKTNADWFPHDVGLRDDDKIKALRENFQTEGYAVYSMLLEYLAHKPFFKFELTEQAIELIAGDFRVPTDRLRQILAYCVKVDLIQQDGLIITCETLEERLLPLLEKRKKDRQRSPDNRRDNALDKDNRRDNHNGTDNRRDNTLDKDNRRESTHSRVEKSREENTHKHLGENETQELQEFYNLLCSIFGRSYVLPLERMPALANWYASIEMQAAKILEVYKLPVAIKQLQAYLKHCSSTNRKKIATVYKLSETLLEADWQGLILNHTLPVKEEKYAEAAYNLTLWTVEAWRSTYANKIKTDASFREHFKDVV